MVTRYLPWGVVAYLKARVSKCSTHYLALVTLPPRTEVYCTHEYTLSNAQFALHVEPNSIAIQQRAEDVQRKRNAWWKYALPSRMRHRVETNPFLRAERALKSFKRLKGI